MRSFLIFTLLFLIGSGAALAEFSLEQCESPKHRAERYLRGLEAYDFYRLEIPACQPLSSDRVPGSWWAELLVLLALAGALSFLARPDGRRDVSRRALVFGLLALVCATLAVENAVRVVIVNRALSVGDEAIRRDDFEQALAQINRAKRHHEAAWLRRIGFWGAAIDQVEVDALREGAGVCAVADALRRGEAPRSVELLDQFPMRTTPGRQAHLAALSWDARHRLREGDPALAVQRSVRALEILPDSPPLHANLSIARYHRALDLVREGEAASVLRLAKGLETPMSVIPRPDQETLRGYAAQAVARSWLEDPKTADPSAAVAALDKARQYALEGGRSYAFIDCDLAGALEADAVLKLARKKPGEAVAALDRSDQLVPGREIVEKLRPKALLAEGTGWLAQRDFEQAIAKLDRAYRETDGNDATIRQALGLAWYSFGAKHQQDGQLDDAISAYRQAARVIPDDDNVALALGDSLSTRADRALRTGDTASAAVDLNDAARYSPEHRRLARQQLRYLPGSRDRLRAIRASGRWLKVPMITGEVPRDLDGDSRVDRLVYYGSQIETPLAVAHPTTGRRPPELLAFTPADASGSAVAIVRDIDRDGRFDERAEYRGEDLSTLLTDIDGDAWPDVRGIEVEPHSFELRQQALSGKVMMRVKGGVIGAAQDFFSDPDIYMILRKNSRYVGSTSTAMDTYYPTWYEGIALDYKYGDRVRLELWDDDVFEDDFVDHYETTSLPTTGIYTFSRRRAAVEIDVVPSELPEGHKVYFDPPAIDSNIFRDNPTAVPEVADIIAGAQHEEATTQAIQWVTKMVVLEVLLPRLLRGVGGWQLFLAQLVVEHAVLDPALGVD